MEIVFGNPVDFGRTERTAFVIGIPKTGGFDYYYPQSAYQSDLNVVFLAFENISLASGNCSVSYDNSAGMLKNSISGQFIPAFTAEFQITEQEEQ